MHRARRPRKAQHETVDLFARRLQEMRGKRGLSQLKLALAAGVNPAYLGRLERAEAAPSLDIIGRLALALGVDVADLVAAKRDSAAALSVLREKVAKSFTSAIHRADEPTLDILSFFASMLLRSLERRR
jgi:transcriptional regulator with XRE-family HTH domain